MRTKKEYSQITEFIMRTTTKNVISLSINMNYLLMVTFILFFATSDLMAQKYVLLTGNGNVLRESPSVAGNKISYPILKQGDILRYIGTENGFYHICLLPESLGIKAYVSGKYAEIVTADDMDSSCLIPCGGCTINGKTISVSPLGDYLNIWMGEMNYLGARKGKIWNIYGPVRGDWDIDKPDALLQQFKVDNVIPMEAFWNEKTECFYILGVKDNQVEAYKCQDMDLD